MTKIAGRMVNSKQSKLVIAFVLMLSILLLPTSSYAEEKVTSSSTAFISASANRDGNGTHIKVTWKGEGDLGKIKIYISSSSTNMKEKGNFLLTTKDSQTSITVKNPNPNGRTYFYLQSSSGASITVAERWLPLKEVANARDLGGYKTTDGKTVKWGLLYRTGGLNNANKSDCNYLKGIGIKKIIDLRDSGELKSSPDPVIKSVKDISINLLGDNASQNVFQLYPEIKDKMTSGSSTGRVKYYMEGVNRYLVTGAIPQKASVKFLQEVLNSKGQPILWHCSAGKDRTGFTAAMLLYALGVPEETIMNEYMLTNIGVAKFFKESYKEAKSDPDKLDDFYASKGVCESYLGSAFEEIKLNYGTVDNYLEKVWGLNAQKKEQLRQIYLEN